MVRLRFIEPFGRRTTLNSPTDHQTAVVCLCSPSEATGNQLAGRRSEAIVFVVHCSGIERRTAINRATDFKPDCVIVFCVPDRGPSDDQLAGRRSEAVAIVGHCSGIERQTAINRATDFMPDCVIVF